MLRHKTPLLLLCFALSACASASLEDVQMSNALCVQGKSLLSSGKNTEARDIYESALHRDDDNVRAWNGLGVANDLLGKRADAKDAYQHAVDLAPDDLTALNNLAHVYIEMGDPNTAIHLLEPHAQDPNASPTLKQNLEAAYKAVHTKQAAAGEIYAELGSYPTEGMAQGHLNEARKILNDKKLVYTIDPEVKVGGGIPTFTVKITGRSPITVCAYLADEAIPCIPHGK